LEGTIATGWAACDVSARELAHPLNYRLFASCGRISRLPKQLLALTASTGLAPLGQEPDMPQPLQALG
jgi:hypothetical protein